jgi:epoxyqueuosine reductase QueG
MDEAEFAERFRGSAIKRAKWRGLIRNALIVAGNRGDPALRPLIERYCQHRRPPPARDGALGTGATDRPRRR